MFRNDSDKDWERFGKEDPYYGVLSHEAFRKGRLTEEAWSAFFATGEEHVRDTFASVEKFLGIPFAPAAAVDFGCGVGRLAIPMTRRCGRVAGVDVSPSMLEEARSNAKRAGRENVVFPGSLDSLAPGRDYDFVHSFIVFQHIPVDRGYALFRDLVSRLRPGGVGVVHFTLTARHSAGKRLLEWLRRRLDIVNIFVNLARGRKPFTPLMQMNEYDLNRLLTVIHEGGCREAKVELTNHHGHLGAILTFRLPLAA